MFATFQRAICAPRAKVRALSDQYLSASPVGEAPRPRCARLVRGGVLLDTELVPLLSGSMHYWRLEPESWRPGLEALRELGCTMVDTYVPWSVHELENGELDFGGRDPQKDVTGFLRIAQDVGLYALVRPGPHINAELTGFGIPKRVLWNPECQARSAAGEPVVLPVPPLAFPVPSYASRAFSKQACHWLEQVADELGPLSWPHGPIVLCQIDNEGSLYFRDGVYDQDYCSDSLALYRAGLQRAYGSPAILGQTYGISVENFDLEPPQRFDAENAQQLARQLDWAEHQESLIADAFGIFRAALARSGLETVPTCHNLPMAESATPLDPARLGRVVECLGIDYYYSASATSADIIQRRTSELTTRADAFDYPAFASELAAGFPPFFPPLTDADNRFTALSSLAAGIRGFNLYMAVERDRWIGAPIDRFGDRRPSADFWQQLNEATQRTRLFELYQAADVCVIVPRSLHRLERLLHAFGPMSPAAFDVMGLSAYDACLEQGPFASLLFEAEAFLRLLCGELAERGIGYRVSGNDSASAVIAQSRCGFVVSGFGLEPELWDIAGEALSRGKELLFGPSTPTTSPNGLLPLAASRKEPVAVTSSSLGHVLDTLTTVHDPYRLSVGRGLRTSLFRDAAGKARVLFVTNPTPSPQIAKLPEETVAVDALDGQPLRATFGALELPLSPHSVRMLELS